MPTRPEDIVNRALDECIVPEIGDLYEGSPQAKAALRVYDPTLRQIFAGAHWNCARKQQSLVLIADVGGTYTGIADVPRPWRYMYEWPVDSVHARFVYQSGITALDRTTLKPIGQCPFYNNPAPMLVASVPITNPYGSSWDKTEGHDPEQTRVILTNELGAVHVYTGLLQYPDAWDPLLEQAMVAALAARLALPCAAAKLIEPQLALGIRRDNIQLAKSALDAARVRDGDEGWTVIDNTPDWIQARSGGYLYYPWMAVPFVGGAY